MEPNPPPSFELELHESEIEKTARQSLTSRLSFMMKGEMPKNVMSQSFHLADRSSLAMLDSRDLLNKLASGWYVLG